MARAKIALIFGVTTLYGIIYINIFHPGFSQKSDIGFIFSLYLEALKSFGPRKIWKNKENN